MGEVPLSVLKEVTAEVEVPVALAGHGKPSKPVCLSASEVLVTFSDYTF